MNIETRNGKKVGSIDSLFAPVGYKEKDQEEEFDEAENGANIEKFFAGEDACSDTIDDSDYMGSYDEDVSSEQDEEPVSLNDDVFTDNSDEIIPTADEDIEKPGDVVELDITDDIDYEKQESADDIDYDELVLPDWVMSMKRKRDASMSHMFLLEGNIRDYMVRNISMENGIVLTLDPNQEEFEIIAKYDQAYGITFFAADPTIMDVKVTSDEYKKRFIKEMQVFQEEHGMEKTSEPPRDIVLLFMIIADIFNKPASDGKNAMLLLFIDAPELLVPESPYAQMRIDEGKLSLILSDMGRSSAADESSNCIIMMSDNTSQLSSRVRNSANRISKIVVPQPSLQERQDFVDNVLDTPDHALSNGTEIFSAEGSITKEYLAINTAGLACYQIEDIVLCAQSDDEPVTAALVRERKNEIIKLDYDELLEVLDPSFGFDAIGGMDQIKEFFMEQVIDPIHVGELEAVPMGIMEMGPPGTGKSLIAKAVAHEAGMNCVALNLNHIMEKWVGSSERNLDRALDCAMAMQPTIIFIDEIDEALPRRGGDDQSAVNKRINKRLLEFFSDTTHRGQVVILAATNHPENVDPAFKRAGRFDIRIPLFAPDEFGRMRIMQIAAKDKDYSFSWFESPDKMIPNPFRNLRKWAENGGQPDTGKFVGFQSEFHYKEKDNLGNIVQRVSYLPDIIQSILDAEKIPLWKFYRVAFILLEGKLEPRHNDTATLVVEPDEEYYARIEETVNGMQDIFGSDENNLDVVTYMLKKYDKVYKSFIDNTDFMTGAELYVVMNKTIVLWRKWIRKHPKGVQEAVARGLCTGLRDIPWHFLEEACRKTTTAVADIKPMEDAALLNSSDTDFIPDAKYITTDDGKDISYKDRHSELILKAMNSK